MQKFGIDFYYSVPPLDSEFAPIYAFNKAYLSGAQKPVSLAIEGGHLVRKQTFIYGDNAHSFADRLYLNRFVKTMLWVYGGYKIYVDDSLAFNYIKADFYDEGKQSFDVKFMSDIYERKFEVVKGESPSERDESKKVGGSFDGCRIGFDAGGSDRKVSAVIDGKTVFSEEVVWNPKTNPDPQYHYLGIVSALKSAAKHLPRVDCVGVSSAGIFINNMTKRASLFLSVEKDKMNQVGDIYIRAIKDTFGDIPFSVCNDGDVSSLAGAITIGENNVLGIAMGTSEAGGFVDACGRITGWLNELAFVPVDVNLNSEIDEWSGDFGCGSKYFSQDAVIKLLKNANIVLEEATPAEKLKKVQSLLEKGDERAISIFVTIGYYLGHTLPFYYDIYRFKYVLLLGRVMSGKGGEIILDSALKVLKKDYPEIYGKIFPRLPDEKFRRMGQSMVAASLPVINRG